MDSSIACAQNDVFNRQLVGEIPFLRNVAKRFQKNDDDAKDLIQDTLYKALKNKNNFRSGVNLKSWLTTILKNTFIDQFHRRKHSYNDVGSDSRAVAQESIREPTLYPIYYTSGISFSHQLPDSYNLAFKSLPSKYRYFIALLDIEGYTYSQVAEFLDCPIGTVRSMIHRGRKIMLETYKNNM